MEAVDPYNISTMTSNLSLGMEPGEIKVLQDIFESDFIGGQDKVENAPIPSLQSLCNHIVDRDMTCPICNSRLQNRKACDNFTGLRELSVPVYKIHMAIEW